MEDGNASGSEGSDGVRRRRRRRKTKKAGLSREARKLLLWARWGLGAVVMAATWIYGIWVSPKLGWGAVIFFPAGIVGMVCIASALSIPLITIFFAILGFLWYVDGGLWTGLRRAAMAFAAVGGANAIWQTLIFFLSKREVTRNEAGYK